jgi:hypothetical protein
VRTAFLCLSLCLALFAAACGTSRTVLHPESPAVLGAASSARVFRIVKVEDDRGFDVHPSTRDIPSLSDRAIHDPRVTSRAVGRSRGMFGKARADFVLPEGESVAELVRACVASALSRAGAVVVSDADPRARDATPIKVRVHRLWTYQGRGFKSVVMRFESAVELRAAVPGFEQGRVIMAQAVAREHSGSPAEFKRVLDQGLMNLTQALARGLESSLQDNNSLANAQ